MQVNALQAKFGIGGSVAFSTGVNGLAKVTLIHQSGASAELYLHGAHVTAWKNAAGDELLLLSEKSVFKVGSPIRGGIPVIFPQFGDGPLPKHGLARIKTWSVLKTSVGAQREPAIKLALENDVETLRLWPFPFRLELAARVGADALTLDFTVRNTGERAFRFNNALHTYFRVADIRRTAVVGLQGLVFADYLRHNALERETRERVMFDRETDRVYISAPDSLRLRDDGRQRVMVIEKSGMNDVVIWNPWIEKAKRLADFGDDEYLRMVCVETGNMATAIELGPGHAWQGQTRLLSSV